MLLLGSAKKRFEIQMKVELLSQNLLCCVSHCSVASPACVFSSMPSISIQVRIGASLVKKKQLKVPISSEKN